MIWAGALGRGGSSVARTVARGAEAASGARKPTRLPIAPRSRAQIDEDEAGLLTCASSSGVHFSFLIAGFTLCRQRCAHC